MKYHILKCGFYAILVVSVISGSCPLQTIGLNAVNMHPIRMDIKVQKRSGGYGSWRPDNPTTERLILGSDNPADLG